jgi:diacylglycerol O-acyltransferase/trehalose O-mycolyltransferase
MRRMWVASAAIVVCLALGRLPALAQEASETPATTAASSPSALLTIGLPADDGARIVAIEEIDARTRDLTIDSPSVGTVKVRLLVPASFDDQPAARFPVLYLLHGAGGDHTEWTGATDVEELTAPTDLLVVMPDANADGIEGWYSDWYNGGDGRQPAWETFHLTELRELLERNWQASDERVIAGLSMGGYGAITYTARHPDLFKAAASYSGVLDITDFSQPSDIARWGGPATNAANWDEHNPIKLVSSLKGVPLYIAYGNGEPGPLDPAGKQKDDLEAWIGQGSDLFVAALEEAGIPATVNAYGPGTHTWPYWQRELHASLPMLLQALGESGVLPSPAPAAPEEPTAASAVSGQVKVTGTNMCDYTDYPVLRCTEQASDPRVSGPATRTTTLEPAYPELGALVWNGVTISGPEGAWTGEAYGVMEEDAVIHVVEISAGSGAYEGLVYATWQTVSPDGNATFAGLIQPGSLPPGFPAAPLPEPSPAAPGE